jgi:hypothetical protein
MQWVDHGAPEQPTLVRRALEERVHAYWRSGRATGVDL